MKKRVLTKAMSDTIEKHENPVGRKFCSVEECILCQVAKAICGGNDTEWGREEDKFCAACPYGSVNGLENCEVIYRRYVRIRDRDDVPPQAPVKEDEAEFISAIVDTVPDLKADLAIMKRIPQGDMDYLDWVALVRKSICKRYGIPLEVKCSDDEED